MRNKLFSSARTIYHFMIGCLWLIRLPFCKRYYASDCYFPELSEKRKTKLVIYFEQVLHIIKWGGPNYFYFLYGLDIKGFHNANDFVDNNNFMRRQNEMNNKFMTYPPISVLRDKALFGIVADAYGIKSPKNIGILKCDEVYLFKEKRNVSYSQLIESKYFDSFGNDLFVKKIDGECADGVYHLTIKDGKLFYKSKVVDVNNGLFEKGRRYLIQESIKGQHQAISSIHPKAINTLRLVTVYNEKTDDVELFSCVLRVGKGENKVDNWAAGGLSIGVDTDNGVLRKYGFYKPGFGTKATEHPDSHIVFEGYKVPYMQDAINQALSLHRHLYGVHNIGWDIAITDDGPCFVEGNDNWEISLMQISNHGLKKEFDQLFH